MALYVNPEQEELERLRPARVAACVNLSRRHVRYRTRLQALLWLSLRDQRTVALQHVYDLVASVIVPAMRPARSGLQPGDDQLVVVDSRQVGAEQWDLGERTRRRDEKVAGRADADATRQLPDDHQPADRSPSEPHGGFLPPLDRRTAAHPSEPTPAC